MAKILFINMRADGHVNPTLPMTKELVARGHQVAYSVTESYRDAIVATGATFKPYNSVWGHDVSPDKETMRNLMMQLPVRLMKEALNIMDQLAAWIVAERPDMILYESMCLAGRFLSESLKIPSISLHASYVSNDHFNLGSQFNFPAPTPEIMDEFEGLMSDAVTRYGIVPVAPRQLLHFNEPMNICFVARAFQIAGDSFDSRFVFTGPNIAPRPQAGTWQAPVGPRRPRLFISLGTVFSNWPDFFDMCFDAFGELDWQVFMATSARVDAKSLRKPPGNFTVATHFPQLDILPHMDVFLTHGGMNSTMESLYFGTPMVVIPQMPEQGVTARRVASLELGVAVDRETVTADVLRNAVAAVASNQIIKDNVLEMRKEVVGSGGTRAAADTVEKYLLQVVSLLGAETPTASIS